jgi:hypothetical protein
VRDVDHVDQNTCKPEPSTWKVIPQRRAESEKPSLKTKFQWPALSKGGFDLSVESEEIYFYPEIHSCFI